MEMLEALSSFLLPLIILIVAFFILFGKRDYFSHFLKGSAEGVRSAIELIPTLCALIVGVNMLRACGALTFLEKILSPVFDFIGIPTEILPLILTRPISGSASLAVFSDIVSTYGPDSFASLCASVIMASSDTVIYVICVYFSCVKIKKTRYSLPLALFVSAICVLLSCILCRIFFE